MFVTLPSMKRLAVIVAVGAQLIGCGGRSAIPHGDGEPLIACAQDSNCFDGNLCTAKACREGYCATVWTQTCNDGDICTADVCTPATGACSYPSWVADNDGDGFPGALPGSPAGTAAACGGNDCNDANASVYPGAPEICDGLDNNCDGRIDEGVNTYSPFGAPVRISDDSFLMGGANGLAFTGDIFGITWTGQQGSKYQGYLSGFDIKGTPRISTTDVSQTSNTSFGGPLLWNGSAFASAWEVRGEQGYDIYFNQLDVNGKKLGPDVRISNGAGFSVQPSLLWDGVNYWVVWSDDNGGDLFRIYGRKVDKDSHIVGDGRALTTLTADARSPAILRSPGSYLLIYLSATNQRLVAQSLAGDMTPSATTTFLSDSGVSTYSADWVGDRFVVAWSIERETVGSTILAATLDAAGNVLRSAQSVTTGANFARAPNIVTLGDRFALAWADDRQTYEHYGIRLCTFDTNLVPLSGVTTLVETAYDCIDPGLATGGSGLALVYRERTNGGTGQPYFLPLACAAGF